MSTVPDQSWFVRPLTPADQPFLREMLYHAIFVPPGSQPPPRAILQQPDIARYVHDWGRTGDLGFGAALGADEQPVGAAWLRLWAEDDRGFGYVDAATPELTIAVLPDHRRRGAGTALLNRLLRAADTLHPAVALSVDRDNPAIALYQRLGFVVARRSGTTMTMVRQAAAGTLPSQPSP